MWYSNEKIQIIGYYVEDLDFAEKIKIEEMITQFNEDMKLENRYKKVCEELEKVKQEQKEEKE